MGLRIEERFEVRAPVDRVWRYLTDPRQVVGCLPGAELTDARDDGSFTGRVRVKVGPIVAGYTGRAEFTEVDEQERVVRLSAEGRESGGTGSARMRMTSRVTALATGATEVRVDAEVDIAGKIVQFGRGMIDTVSKQLFRQFADCARARLELDADATVPVRTDTAAVAAPLPVAEAHAAHPPASRAGEPVRILPLLLGAFRGTVVASWRKIFRRRAI